MSTLTPLLQLWILYYNVSSHVLECKRKILTTWPRQDVTFKYENLIQFKTNCSPKLNKAPSYMDVAPYLKTNNALVTHYNESKILITKKQISAQISLNWDIHVKQVARFWKILSANIDSHWQIWQQTATKGKLRDSEKSGIGPFSGDGNIGMPNGAQAQHTMVVSLENLTEVCWAP